MRGQPILKDNSIAVHELILLTTFDVSQEATCFIRPHFF